jgi:hypothetical protein
MSEINKYTPENTEYGTKHDGELVFPEHIEFALRKQIRETLEQMINRGVQEHKFAPPMASEMAELEKFWFERAGKIYTRLLTIQHGAFSMRLPKKSEQLFLDKMFEFLKEEMATKKLLQLDPPISKTLEN